MVKIDIPMPNSCIECPFAYVEYPTDIPGCNIMECLPNCPDFGTRTPIGQKDKNCPLSTTPPTQPDGISLEWIDKHLEWLDNCDNDFAQLAKVGIRAMVDLWKKDRLEKSMKN